MKTTLLVALILSCCVYGQSVNQPGGAGGAAIPGGSSGQRQANVAGAFRGISSDLIITCPDDDTTDCTTAINAAMASLTHAPGGICGGAIYFPVQTTGKYLVSGQIVVPVFSGTSTCPIRLYGPATFGDWNNTGAWGTILDLRYKGTNGGQILALGKGSIEIDHLTLWPSVTPTTNWSVGASTLTNIVVASNVATVTMPSAHGLVAGNYVSFSGSGTAALNGTFQLTAAGMTSTTVFTVNTLRDGLSVGNGTYTDATVEYVTPVVYTNMQHNFHDNWIKGDTSKTGATANQDVFVVGGSELGTGTGINLTFLGLSSTIERNNGDYIRRLVYLRAQAQEIVVNNKVYDNSGTNAQINASGYEDLISAGFNTFSNNQIGGTYKNGITLRSIDNLLTGNTSGDTCCNNAGQSMVYIQSVASGNIVTNAGSSNGPVTGGAGSNNLIITTPATGSTYPSVQVCCNLGNSQNFLATGNIQSPFLLGSIGATYSTMWSNGVTPTANNWSFTAGSDGTYINTPGATPLNFWINHTSVGSATSSLWNFAQPVKATGYQSSDGSAGVTGSTCTAWKNGLCTAP